MTRWRGLSRTPACRPIGEALIETLDALEYVDEIRGFRVLVRAHFVCDGPSVPLWAWPLASIGFMELLPHSILHDALYRRRMTIAIYGQSVPVPNRAFADRTMAEAMMTRQSTRDAARSVRLGLFLGGWSNWQKKDLDWRG